MKLRLSLVRGNRLHDVAIDADPHATVGMLAARLAPSNANGASPATLRIHRSGASDALYPGVSLAESGVRAGDQVVVTEATGAGGGPRSVAAELRIVRGPGAGTTYPLPYGSSTIGRSRDAAVRLIDPMVSKHHARISVTDVVEIVDTMSANGVIIADRLAERAVVGPADEILLGDTVVTIHRVGSVATPLLGNTVPFNRSPYLDPQYPGREYTAPEPPQPPHAQRFPVTMLAMPIMMAGVMWAVSGNVASLAFVAMSPLMMLGSFLEQRRQGRIAFAEAAKAFHESLGDLVVTLQREVEVERAARHHEHPATADAIRAASDHSVLLWSRRPDRVSFLDLRLGIGTQASRNSIVLPSTRNTTPELWRELTETAQRFASIDRVPVVGAFTECGSIGVGGPNPQRSDAARGLVAQMVALHSPAELAVAAIVPLGAADDWTWLKWLPHVDSEHSPLRSGHLAASAPTAAVLVAGLLEMIEERAANDRELETVPAVVVVIDEAAPFDRARLVDIAERGPAVGVYTLWLGSAVQQLPAVCRKFLAVDPNSGTSGVGSVFDGSYTVPVEYGPLSVGEADAFARSLAPLVDASALLDDAGELPARVSFATEEGHEVMSDDTAIIDRWRQSNSIAADGVHAKRERTLRAFVGTTATGPLLLDLRLHGPHALVGGTTGSGKSEFLQTWLLGLATAHSPERVNFLLVDYKGGSAFGQCAELPHSVGLVTDLTPRLVRRALISLRAELIRREHVLQQWTAKDLIDLESKERDGAPVVPSLVIVVDEFAALVQEVPDFVDGMIDIAQRGRSLGLHLVLATQRPSGVIKGNLRANTNLRIALRMADADDSTDVVGTPAAGDFDPALPGRGIAKTGPGKLLTFQAAYVGGRTSSVVPPPRISISDLPFGVGSEWETPPEVAAQPFADGPKDLERIVARVQGAFDSLGMEVPSRPWLPELASRYELSQLSTKRLDSQLVFAITDDPQRQQQYEVAFEPDRVGNVAVLGVGGSGKSATLRSLAVAAGLSIRGGPCHVYGIDFGARGLQMLEQLPHVGSIISGDDDERVARLVRWLRELIDDRAQRFAAVRAGSIAEYRTLANAPEEPRILVLVDNFAGFRSDYELGPKSRILDQLHSVAMDGRAVGVHVAASADRQQSLTNAMASVAPYRIVLRLTDDMDLALMGLGADAFETDTPPGRGYVNGNEVQVAVLGGVEFSIASQAEAMAQLAVAMRDAGVGEAPAIRRLPEVVPLTSLPDAVGSRPTLGVADDTLEPIGFNTGSCLVVTGPPGSGKSRCTAALVESLRRWNPNIDLTYFGNDRSPLAAFHFWTRSALDAEAAEDVARQLLDELETQTSLVERAVVIENIGDFVGTLAEDSLLRVVNAVSRHGRDGFTLIAEGPTASMSQYSPLLKEIRSFQHGLLLQPNQGDGDSLLGISLPRLQRSEFPPGRGMYVAGGTARRVHVAIS